MYGISGRKMKEGEGKGEGKGEGRRWVIPAFTGSGKRRGAKMGGGLL